MRLGETARRQQENRFFFFFAFTQSHSNSPKSLILTLASGIKEAKVTGYLGLVIDQNVLVLFLFVSDHLTSLSSH